MKTQFYLLLILFSTNIVNGQAVQKAIGLNEKNEPAKAKEILRTIDDNSPNYAKSQFYLGRITFDD